MPVSQRPCSTSWIANEGGKARSCLWMQDGRVDWPPGGTLDVLQLKQGMLSWMRRKVVRRMRADGAERSAGYANLTGTDETWASWHSVGG